MVCSREDIDTAVSHARLGELHGCRDRQVLSTQAEVIYMLGTILLIVLILLLIGAFPSWPHSRSWGYAPTGGIGIVVIVVIVLVVAGVI
jgi:hypothetical protein